jgi:hypothetical protein
MKTSTAHRALCVLCCGVGVLLAARLPAADFNVTSPGVFTINGINNNPTLTLVRGRTYTFSLATTPGFHPFFIGTAVGSAVAPAGVSGANGGSSGTITFVVPTNAPNCVYYCTVHQFFGNIIMTDPPPPPVIRIVNYSIGTNIILRSTGTNTYTLFPEYKTNLNVSNWFALTVQTNRFTNGTNETICGRPSASNVFIRIRATAN